jgi:orotate phosphoribosyltransferase
MTDRILQAVSARLGHFKLESGHHSDLWLDLETLCLRPGLECEFLYTERFERRSTQLFPVEYHVPKSLHACVSQRRVAIVNDVTSAGSAVRGSLRDLQTLDADVVAIGSLLVLGTSIVQFAREREVPLVTLRNLPHNLWTPSECPLCKSNVALDSKG